MNLTTHKSNELPGNTLSAPGSYALYVGDTIHVMWEVPGVRSGSGEIAMSLFFWSSMCLTSGFLSPRQSLQSENAETPFCNP
jgi:hypothetical protein